MSRSHPGLYYVMKPEHRILTKGSLANAVLLAYLVREQSFWDARRPEHLPFFTSRKLVAVHTGLTLNQVDRARAALREQGFLEEEGVGTSNYLQFKLNWFTYDLEMKEASKKVEEDSRKASQGLSWNLVLQGAEGSPKREGEGSPKREGEGSPKREGKGSPKREPFPPYEEQEGEREELSPARREARRLLQETPPPPELSVHKDFMDAATDWLEKRLLSEKSKFPPGALRGAWRKLSRYPVPIALEAMENAAIGGYKGVFPESVGQQRSPGGPRYGGSPSAGGVKTRDGRAILKLLQGEDDGGSE